MRLRPSRRGTDTATIAGPTARRRRSSRTTTSRVSAKYIRPVDVGAMRTTASWCRYATWRLTSLRPTHPGRSDPDDLRRVAAERVASDRDLARLDTLAAYLAGVHVRIPGTTGALSAISVGHGEGIFGIVTASLTASCHPSGCDRSRSAARPALAAPRLPRTADAHARRFSPVQHRVRRRADAARRESRRCGDPADDVTALAINFMLFGSIKPAWRGLGMLWRRWWRARPRRIAVLAVAPPFFAWRALVGANPRSTAASPQGRRAALVCRAPLDAGRLDPAAPRSCSRDRGVDHRAAVVGKSTLARHLREASAASCSTPTRCATSSAIATTPVPRCVLSRARRPRRADRTRGHHRDLLVAATALFAAMAVARELAPRFPEVYATRRSRSASAATPRESTRRLVAARSRRSPARVRVRAAEAPDVAARWR